MERNFILTIYEFRNVAPLTEVSIPEKAENRKCTDVVFLAIFGITILGFIICMCVMLPSSQWKMFTHGYDKCGNICGMENEIIPGINCSGGNMVNKPLMQIEVISITDRVKYLVKVCVEKCPEFSIFSHGICYVDENFNFTEEPTQMINNINDTIDRYWIYIFFTVSFGILSCLNAMILFKYYPKQMLWITYISGMMFQLNLIVYFTVAAVVYQNNDVFLVYAISSGVITLYFMINILFLIFFYQQFRLVMRLIEEVVNILSCAPWTLLQPFIFFLATICLVFLFTYLTILLWTCRKLRQSLGNINRYEYQFTPFLIVCFAYTALLFWWLVFFLNGCGQMVLAGTFARYYFTRYPTCSRKDRSKVKNALTTSYYILLRFHLGTVAFGSLIINLANILQSLIKRCAESENNICVKCCLNLIGASIREMIEFLSKYAYIQTALHGSPLCKSGKRAARLLWANLIATLSISACSTFIVFNLVFTLTFLTMLFSIIIGFHTFSSYYWVVILIGALITLFICGAISSVLEIAIGTVFMCYCEDQMMNDGTHMPFFTNDNIQKLIEDAKKLQAVKPSNEDNE